MPLASQFYRFFSFAVFATFSVSCASNSLASSLRDAFINSSQLIEGEQTMTFSLSSDDQDLIECVNTAIQKTKLVAEQQQQSVNVKLIKHTIRFSKNVTPPFPQYEQLFASIDSCRTHTPIQAELKFERLKN